MAVTINLNNVQGAATARTAAQWVSDNPIIPANYVGFETDTGKYKLGDGVTAWNSLSYPAFGGGGGVPYTGATQSLDMGEFGVDAGFYQYDVTPTNTPTAQGTAYWDDNAETVALIMNGVTQKIGEDTFFHVKNSTGSNIAAGVAVRFAGTDGNSGKLLIAPFLADGTYPSEYFMGVTAEAIDNGEEGKVYQFGKMKQINTSAYQDSDILYASSTVAGGYQTTAPAAPNNVISVAAVVSAANNGVLMIRPIIEDAKFANLRGNISDNTALQNAFDGKVDENTAITGATKTKITYDAKGLVTAGADAAIADITGLQTALDAKQNTLTNPITGTGTSGQVSFFNGTTTQTGDNGLFWDNTNKRLGIGTNSPNSLIHITGSNTASGGASRGLNLTPTLIAAANNDVLYALDISPTFTNGAFTGVANRGIVSIVDTNSVYAGVFIRNSSNGTSAFASISVANDIASVAFQITGSGNTIVNVTPNQARFRTDSGISNGFNFITGNASAPISFSIGDITRMRIFGGTGNLIIQSGGTFTDAGAKLQVQTGAVGTVGQIITAAAGQTADLLQLRSSAAAVLTSFTDNGAWKPASLADANADNGSVYYSTDQSKLVYKDSAGVVNDLY